MLKKLFIILFISIFLQSCGKKGDPIYDGKNQKTQILINQKSRSL